MMPSKQTTVAFNLNDPITGQQLQGEVTVGTYGVELAFDGYSDHGTQPPHSRPIFIEFYNGELRVCLWKDINEQDPQVISMEDAKESNRRNE